MNFLQLTSEHDTSYQPPRDNVLLLTCMDLRLLDNIASFMNHDNLTNRYDQVVFAGASLGALGAPGAKDKEGNDIDVSYWLDVFLDHLDAAVKLHDIKDVYILEHRHCGAYYKVFNVSVDFDDTPEQREAEERCHHHYAVQLEEVIADWAEEHGVELRTHKFLMDLRGNVSVLREPPPAKGRGKRAGKK